MRVYCPTICRTVFVAPVVEAPQGPEALSNELQSPREGFYYRDPSGKVQGPFTQEAIEAWRPYLPMDMKVWLVQEQDFLYFDVEYDEADIMPASTSAAAASQSSIQSIEINNLSGHRSTSSGTAVEEARDPGSIPHTAKLLQFEESGNEVPEVELPSACTIHPVGNIGALSKTQALLEEAVLLSTPEEGVSLQDGASIPSNEPTATAVRATQLVDQEERIQGLESEHSATEACRDLRTTDTSSLTTLKRKSEAPTCTSGCVTNMLSSEQMSQLLSCLPFVELAELVGDGVLLADWRAQVAAGLAPPSPFSPPATVWEHWLLYGPRTAASGGSTGAHEASGGAAGLQGSDVDGESSKLGYAAAVLAGLPPDDEAVIISNLALSAGKSLQDVINFNYSLSTSSELGPPQPSVDFSTAIRNPHSGRLVAAGSEDTPQSYAATLYGEMSRWCKPEDLERSLQEAAQRKGQKLPTHVWKKLAERKVQMKKKMRLLAMQ
ncbi:hypothetical protein CEUSTIGMA_g5156.t1 [Chlamydomonas eustigma]|uniref:GYF domain-containing protein n=1 Tax=Chlamydomonas eustigma TaxID=1157962 RepID=A0A250X3Q6_9CHLO|nr:hypothetical protein CEUSTIGMA_g5156.t1 [Chlamydomonas eustigma]|eukprot:GAX77713.1 hypothetical protein CEUSTIGMA_g5156.t1 [Chlamydomonas eustigma]